MFTWKFCIEYNNNVDTHAIRLIRFGRAMHDEMSILAPLYQCCTVRLSTVRTLLELSDGRSDGGRLSERMRRSLSKDPLHPVITEAHLEALDRRVDIVLDQIYRCVRRFDGERQVIVDVWSMMVQNWKSAADVDILSGSGDFDCAAVESHSRTRWVQLSVQQVVDELLPGLWSRYCVYRVSLRRTNEYTLTANAARGLNEMMGVITTVQEGNSNAVQRSTSSLIAYDYHMTTLPNFRTFHNAQLRKGRTSTAAHNYVSMKTRNSTKDAWVGRIRSFIPELRPDTERFRKFTFACCHWIWRTVVSHGA